MKKCGFLNFVMVVTLFLSLVGIGQVLAQDNPSSQPQAAPQEQSSPPSGTEYQPQAAKAFTGKIMKDGGKLVLKDMAGTTYQLDDQQKAKKFAGKEVKVIGSLDASSNTIHVENIELSS